MFFFQRSQSFPKLAAVHKAELAAATNSVSIAGGMTFQKHSYPTVFPSLMCCTLLNVTDGTVADQRRQAAPLRAWIQRCCRPCPVEVADLLRAGSMVAVLHVLLRRTQPIVFCLFNFLFLNSRAPPGVASLCPASPPSVPQVSPLLTLLLLLRTPLTTLQCFVYTLLLFAVPGCSSASLTCHICFMSLVATHQDPLC